MNLSSEKNTQGALEYRLLKFNADFGMNQPDSSKTAAVGAYDISPTGYSEYLNKGHPIEYDHQDSGLENTDFSKVCAHAAAMAVKRDQEGEGTSALAALARDYVQAIKCLQEGGDGDCREMDAFTQYMLAADWKTVIDALTGMFNSGKKDDKKKKIAYLPDFGKLLVAEADRALLLNGDIAKALEGYSVAAFNWKNVYDGSGCKYALTWEEKEKIRSYAGLYSSILHGESIGDDHSFLCEDEKRIVSKYKKIVSKEIQHEEIVNDIEELIGVITDVLHAPRAVRKDEAWPSVLSGLNTVRTVAVMLPKLLQLGYLDEIRLLSAEPPDVQNDLKPLALKKLHLFVNTDLDWLWYTILGLDEKKEWPLLTAVSKVAEDVRHIKKALLLNGRIPDLAYYTTWKTLSYMLPNEKTASDYNTGRFSVMHLSYMNDPMEGIVIEKFLFGNSEQAGRKQESQPYVFVKCFTQSIDYLPMWKMYGEDAAGCCIVIDWNETIKRNPGKNIALYRVCYLRKNNKGEYTFIKGENEKEISHMTSLLDKLKKDVSGLRDVYDDGHLLQLLLSSITYLFKDSSYSYEKEARIMYSHNRITPQMKLTEQEPPKLYVYPDYRVMVKELILGPRFQDIYLWLPFIRMQLEKMNEVTNKEKSEDKAKNTKPYATKLSLSEINYR